MYSCTFWKNWLYVYLYNCNVNYHHQAERSWLGRSDYLSLVNNMNIVFLLALLNKDVAHWKNKQMVFACWGTQNQEMYSCKNML